MSGILSIVKGCPLFYELYDTEILKIVEKCQVLSLEEGDYVFKEGDEGDELFIILGGGVSVEKTGIVLANLKKGDLFGELVILDEFIRSADIVANTYTDLLIIRSKDIFSHFKNDTKIFSLLILNMSRLLTKRLKTAGQDIKELNLKLAHLKSQKSS